MKKILLTISFLFIAQLSAQENKNDLIIDLVNIKLDVLWKYSTATGISL